MLIYFNNLWNYYRNIIKIFILLYNIKFYINLIKYIFNTVTIKFLKFIIFIINIYIINIYINLFKMITIIK